MSNSLYIVSLSELYDNGFTIKDLDELVVPQYEELYHDHDPKEIIRKIARSQDARSYYVVESWLKERLIESKPQRKYNIHLQAVIDNTINTFLYGDDMPKATSATHQALLANAQADLSKRKNNTLSEIIQELEGFDYSELPSAFDNIIVPKFKGEWTNSEFASILADVVKIMLVNDSFAYSVKMNLHSRNHIDFSNKMYEEVTFVFNDYMDKQIEQTNSKQSEQLTKSEQSIQLQSTNQDSKQIESDIASNSTSSADIPVSSIANIEVLNTKTLIISTIRHEADGVVLSLFSKKNNNTREFFWRNGFPILTDISALKDFIGTDPRAFPLLVDKLKTVL